MAGTQRPLCTYLIPIVLSHACSFHVARRFGRVFVAGAGFLADSYDIFVINIALMMMKDAGRYEPPLTHEIQTWVREG